MKLSILVSFTAHHHTGDTMNVSIAISAAAEKCSSPKFIQKVVCIIEV
jgi:hypothetical protein